MVSLDTLETFSAARKPFGGLLLIYNLQFKLPFSHGIVTGVPRTFTFTFQSILNLTLTLIMTLTFGFDSVTVKLIHHAKCLGQRSFRLNVIVRRNTLDRMLYLDHMGFKYCCYTHYENYKNSSGDEIANVNFFYLSLIHI